jgi:hypothetical protein
LWQASRAAQSVAATAAAAEHTMVAESRDADGKDAWQTPASVWREGWKTNTVFDALVEFASPHHAQVVILSGQIVNRTRKRHHIRVVWAQLTGEWSNFNL